MKYKSLFLLFIFVNILYLVFRDPFLFHLTSILLNHHYERINFNELGFSIILYAMSILTVVFLWRKKEWAIMFLNIVFCLMTYKLFRSLVLINYKSLKGVGIIATVALIVFILLYVRHLGINRKDLEKNPYNQYPFRLFSVFIIAALALFGGYYFFKYYFVYSKSCKLNSILWSEKEKISLKKYKVQNIVFNFPGILNESVESAKSSLTNKFHVFYNEDKSIRINIINGPLNEMIELLGYQNSYDLAKRLHRMTRFWVEFNNKKDTTFTEMINNDGFRIFQIINNSSIDQISRFYLFCNLNNSKENFYITVVDKNGSLTKDTWLNVVGSVKEEKQ